MKILHLSHNGLPDTRVERAALTGINAGYDTCFAGPFVKNTHLPVKVFNELYEVPFDRFANVRIPPYWKTAKRRISRILTECQPDFVHAHNIVAARLISEFAVPFIFDDHEYWSKQCQLRASPWKPQRMFIKWLWTRWEEEVLSKASATITVSETIAEEHEELCNNVYIAPNFPSLIETKLLRLDDHNVEELSSIYVGLADFSHSKKHMLVPHRNTKGVVQIYNDDSAGTLTVIGDPDLQSSENIKSLGVLRHQTVLKEMTRHQIGLLPWKKHWYHKYCNPNKPYEYAHAGLFVITVSDLVCVIQRLQNYCATFDDFDGLSELLHYYAGNLEEILGLRHKIREFALRNLVWERECEPEILRAYSKI